MKTYICDHCGKVIKNSPYKISIPKYLPIQEVVVSGVKVGEIGHQWQSEESDLCYDCFCDLGRALKNIDF